MGIEKLMPFIRKNCTNGIKKIPLDHFSGRRIAVDGFHWLYSNLFICHRETVNNTDLIHFNPDFRENNVKIVKALIKFCERLLKLGVTPLIFWDGLNIPPEKFITREERKVTKQKAKEKIEVLLKYIRNPKRDILIPIYSQLQDLRTLLSNNFSIPEELVLLVKDILSIIGVPSYEAYGEAEKTCAMLSLNKTVSGVFSIDTDNLVYGVEFLITHINTEEVKSSDSNYQCTTIHLPTVLKELDLTHSQFVDFCIMCGCDYNDKIKGISTKRAYDKIKNFKTLEEIGKTMDISKYNYVKCRELFSQSDKELITLDKLSWTIDNLEKEKNKKIMKMFDLDYWYPYYPFLYKLYNSTRIIKELDIKQYPNAVYIKRQIKRNKKTKP